MLEITYMASCFRVFVLKNSQSPTETTFSGQSPNATDTFSDLKPKNGKIVEKVFTANHWSRMETAINKTTRSLFASFPRNRCFGFIEPRRFSDTVSHSASARHPDYYQSLRVKVTSSCDTRHEDAVGTRIVDLTCLENRRTRFRLMRRRYNDFSIETYDKTHVTI